LLPQCAKIIAASDKICALWQHLFIHVYISEKMRLSSILIGMGQNNMENDAMEYLQCGVTIDCSAPFANQPNSVNFTQRTK
jgi:hypothetical protein